MTNVTIETIKLADIIYDKNCQRIEGTDQRRVGRMADNFNPDAMGTIVVSRRGDGTMAILDGAHRVEAAKKVGQPDAKAIIHHGLSRADEARMFVELNTFKAPSAVSRFIARVTAGDEDAVDIHRIVTAHGRRIVAMAADGTITCPQALERIYSDCAGTKKKGAHPDDLEWVLDVVGEAWGDEYAGAASHVILGLAQLRGRFGAGIQTKKLAKELSLTRPETLIARAKVLRDAQGGTIPAAMAKIMAGLHNKKLRAGLLPEWVWIR